MSQNQTEFKEKNQHFQSCYSKVQGNLQTYFVLKMLIFFLIIFTGCIFLNQLYKTRQNSKPFDSSFSYLANSIQNQFSQMTNLMFKLFNIIHKILDKQYSSMQKKGELYFLQRDNYFSTSLKQTIYSKYFGTTGEYECLNGNCTALIFYLQSLWTFKIHHKSIDTIYLSYYDPIQQNNLIAIVPSDSSLLNDKQVSQLFKQKNSSLSYFMYKNKLYLSITKTKNISSSLNQPIQIIISINKAQFQLTLNQITPIFRQYAPFELTDDLGWLKLNENKSFSIFQSVLNQFKLSYVIQVNNKFENKLSQLISITFKASIIKSQHQFLSLILLAPLLILLLQFYLNSKILKQYLKYCFQPLKKLSNLYQFNINQIFSEKRPNCSIILTDNSLSKFYQNISQIPNSDFEPICKTKKSQLQKQQLKFISAIKKIQNKYHEYTKDIFQQKNRQIINNKFFIHSQVNQISEIENKKLKEHFQRCKQLGLIQHFFKFAYLSLIRSPQQYDQIIEKDFSPLPTDAIAVFRSINRTISSHDIRKAFKLSSNIRKQTQDELEMRIQIDLLQKYLQILKDLDIHNQNVQILGFQKQIQNLSQRIQNIKHILNKHNKNIRTYNK